MNDPQVLYEYNCEGKQPFLDSLRHKRQTWSRIEPKAYRRRFRSPNWSDASAVRPFLQHLLCHYSSTFGIKDTFDSSGKHLQRHYN
jgi:hypothetical protein